MFRIYERTVNWLLARFKNDREEEATIETEAERKYDKYKSKDPFPNIAPALLNSADISDYVGATGMLDPFYSKNLKPASYEAAIAGQCKYWDENGEEHNIFLEKEGDKFTLLPNSIAFVEVEPTFRLPDYMALRFNLKITHVYRGLLLGTGPLIDPGYKGKIYIPLHNLTSNEYPFFYGDGLIWIEFTKVSENERWHTQTSELSRSGTYVSFPESKFDKRLEDFLRKANQGNKVGSSIPDAVGEAKEKAALAEKSAEDAKKSARASNILTFISIIAFFVGFVALMYSSWTLQRDYIHSFHEKVELLEEENIDLRAMIEDMAPKIRALEQEPLKEDE